MLLNKLNTNDLKSLKNATSRALARKNLPMGDAKLNAFVADIVSDGQMNTQAVVSELSSKTASNTGSALDQYFSTQRFAFRDMDAYKIFREETTKSNEFFSDILPDNDYSDQGRSLSFANLIFAASRMLSDYIEHELEKGIDISDITFDIKLFSDDSNTYGDFYLLSPSKENIEGIINNPTLSLSKGLYEAIRHGLYHYGFEDTSMSHNALMTYFVDNYALVSRQPNAIETSPLKHRQLFSHNNYVVEFEHDKMSVDSAILKPNSILEDMNNNDFCVLKTGNGKMYMIPYKPYMKFKEEGVDIGESPFVASDFIIEHEAYVCVKDVYSEVSNIRIFKLEESDIARHKSAITPSSSKHEVTKGGKPLSTSDAIKMIQDMGILYKLLRLAP